LFAALRAHRRGLRTPTRSLSRPATCGLCGDDCTAKPMPHRRAPGSARPCPLAEELGLPCGQVAAVQQMLSREQPLVRVRVPL
jgi:hypothetical protein